MIAPETSERAEQLLALTERLTAAIAQETHAFENRRPFDAAVSLDETARLANLYRHESARLRRDPALIAGAPAPLRGRLVDATLAFEAALTRHERALEAAKTVTEGVVRAIAEEIASTRATGAGYGPGAKAAPGSAAASTAITLNRRA